MEKSKSNESFKFDFFGLKFECVNPGIITIIILLILLFFSTAAIILLKELALPTLLFGAKKTGSLLLTVIFYLIF